MEFEGMETETASYTWPPRIPTRLKKRLHCKTPCTTADQIQAKLRLADLRRQEYYEKLSNKARPKPRSPSRSDEEDLAQRLEAKLQAAAQKRLSLLEKAQTRLAKLDELRQAAKNSVELRYEREREKLGSKVKLRFEQAEANRAVMLKAHRQRRASLRERSSQSLLRKAARESKYKERVRAAIHRKRAAAERNRSGLLEAERKRVCARILMVRRVAKAVNSQREIERRRMKDQLEDRLQRARSQRAEYLRQRGRVHDSDQTNWHRMQKHGDILSRRLARYWKQFLKQRTTLDLAKSYDSLNINTKSVGSMPFEQLALSIESTDTLRSVKAILDRFEKRLRVLKALPSSSSSGSVENIDHLLKRVATPKKRVTPRKPLRAREASKKEVAKNPIAPPLPRYSVRVSLCAYMILIHPEAVFSGRGDREIALAKSAEKFVRELELLVRIVLEGPVNGGESNAERLTFRAQLESFDRAWCWYLNCFVVWKDKDAQSLEEDLVRAACQLELSMMQTCKISPDGDSNDLTHDMRAVQKQVSEDQKLLREKVFHISGEAGIKRMESSLSETRSKYFLAKENGSPTGSLFISPSSKPGPSSSDRRITNTNNNSNNNGVRTVEKPSVVRSLFRDGDDSSTPKGSNNSSGPNSRAILDGPLGAFVAENELIVNEYIHNRNGSFTDMFGFGDEDDQNGIKEKIKETMKNAFWDSITESMKSENPDYDRVVRLVSEVRDEICQMAPVTWKQMIVEAIDLDILSQVLKSGNLDINYLGKIMEFSLDTLQKLSSPASDEKMKTTRQSLMKELAEICEATDGSNHSCVIAMIKGLRFVLDKIQVLKQEISKARITLMAQVLKGPEGLEYLKNAFANRHGSPSDAKTNLSLTIQWWSTVSGLKDLEWEEHRSALSALDNGISARESIPSTALRTGGTFGAKPNMTKTEGGDTLPECKGEKIDLMVKVGLLKLVSGVSGLTQEVLPETFMLNLSRLRAVQSQIQKIIVIAVSVLICRQSLVTVDNAKEIDSVISTCTERLIDLLNRDEEAGIEEIIESIGQFSKKKTDEAQKAVMTRMIAKSLRAGDPVFERVSRAVYTSARGVMLSGSGPRGRRLAEVALRQVGAAALTERVVEAAGVLAVAATVSVSVHGPWYAQFD